MTIHDYLRILRRNLVLILSTTLIGLSLGMLSALTTPTRYDATAELFVSVQASRGNSAELNQGRAYAQQAVSSYVELATSALVLQPVIDELGLAASPSELATRIRADARPSSVALTITASSRNPSQAARLANAVSESFSTVVTETIEKHGESDTSPVRIDTLQRAQVPITPSAPNYPLSIIIGGLLGLAAGAGIAALRTVVDTRIRSITDIDAAVDAPVLGAVPSDRIFNRMPLVVASAPRSPSAEAFRTLRTNAQFLAIDGGPAVFVITSSGPTEGKSTTAANLAIAFAESGAATVLVDADLRIPRVASLFGIEGSVGLSDVLAGRVHASDVLQRWGRGTLFVLPAGTRPPNPAELLGSSAMNNLIADLKQAFSVVIIDAPPVLLVTDAAVLAQRSTGAILVAAAGVATAPRLTAAVAGIEKAGAKVLGTIITMVPTTGPDKTAYGAYSYQVQSTNR